MPASPGEIQSALGASSASLASQKRLPTKGKRSLGASLASQRHLSGLPWAPKKGKLQRGLAWASLYEPLRALKGPHEGPYQGP